MFEKFKNKYIFTGDLIVKTALHIGAGIEYDDKDSPFVKTSRQGFYYIPGSSFRGYLRSKIEKYLNDNNQYHIYNNKGEKLNNQTINNLFGYTDKDSSQATKVFIEDMLLITDKFVDSDKCKNMGDIVTVTRDGIKINPETGTTEKGGKFDYDVITMGNIFEFRIVLENIEDYELDLIKLGLMEICSQDGDLIGGKLSRGIGRCFIENLTLHSVDANSIEDVKNYFFKGEMKNIKLDKLEINNIDIK